MEAYVAREAREARRKLKKDCLRTYQVRLFAFIEQGANRKYNMYYQKIRIAFAHLKARADVGVYLRTPMGRYLAREREQERERCERAVVCPTCTS